MYVEILYSSLTGCTRKVAQAIAEGLPDHHVTVHDLADGIPSPEGDIVLVGYWGIRGGPDEKTAEFLRSIEGRAVGIFCTLGYYAGTGHANATLASGIDLVKDRNLVIGGYVCNGAVASSLKKGQGKDPGAIPTEQKELRWAVTASHPTKAECDLAAERFRERIWMYGRARELNIPWQSIL